MGRNPNPTFTAGGGMAENPPEMGNIFDAQTLWDRLFWHRIPSQGHNGSLLDSVLTKAPDPLLPNGLQGASSSLLEELIREASASAPSHLNTICGEALVQGIDHF